MVARSLRYIAGSSEDKLDIALNAIEREVMVFGEKNEIQEANDTVTSAALHTVEAEQCSWSGKLGTQWHNGRHPIIGVPRGGKVGFGVYVCERNA